MKVHELIDILAKADPTADVELVVDEDFGTPMSIEDIDLKPKVEGKVFIMSEPL